MHHLPNNQIQAEIQKSKTGLVDKGVAYYTVGFIGGGGGGRGGEWPT